MSSAPLVMLDCETTGLDPTDEVWEVAAIRRDPDGTETERTFFVEHDEEKASALPLPFRADHDLRYDGIAALSRHDAADWVRLITRPTPEGVKAHLVGLNPAFDAAMLTTLLASVNIEPLWSYHLIDVEAMALGYLHAFAQGVRPLEPGAYPALEARAEELRQIATPPYSSDELARAVGIYPDQYERHTALGDARFARDIYDAITRG